MINIFNQIIPPVAESVNITPNEAILLTESQDASSIHNHDLLYAPFEQIQHQFFPAGSFIPRVTDGAEITSDPTEYAINGINLDEAAYDNSVDEACQITCSLDRWDGGTIKVKVACSSASGTGTAVFEVNGRAYISGDNIDQAFGTAQTCTATISSANQITDSTVSNAITIAGNPINGAIVQLQILRNGGTLAEDSKVQGAWIEWITLSTAETAWS